VARKLFFLRGVEREDIIQEGRLVVAQNENKRKHPKWQSYLYRQTYGAVLANLAPYSMGLPTGIIKCMGGIYRGAYSPNVMLAIKLLTTQTTSRSIYSKAEELSAKTGVDEETLIGRIALVKAAEILNWTDATQYQATINEN
jgi:hypothetical protein